MKPIISLLLLALGAAGCNSSKRIKSASSNATLTDTYWKLTILMGKPIQTTADNITEMHIILKEKDNQVKGHGSCNNFSGAYEQNKNSYIIFLNLVSTERVCLNMENETTFFKILNAVDRYNINGNTLLLNNAKMETLARFEAVYLK